MHRFHNLLLLLPLLHQAAAAVALSSSKSGEDSLSGGSPRHRRGAEPHGGHWEPPPSSSSASVAYFLENEPAGSSIVSLQVAANGSLSQPVRTSTGGRGSIEVDSTGTPFVSDSLGSQGSVTIAENMIFTVNAGSNTVSMFVIDPRDPDHPKLVGSPVGTQGEFPISVTYSAELRKACVLNGGSVAGVTCYTVDPHSGLELEGPLRRLNTSIINETTPPQGPPGSAAQVLFNPDSSAIFATVKASSTTGQGSLVVWPVAANGTISTAEPVVNHIPGIALDFGFTFLSRNTIYLADPSFGIALLDVGPDFTVTETAHTVIPAQVATCWTQFEPALNTLYAIDAGGDLIHTLHPQTGTITGSFSVQIPGGNTTMGVFDSAIRNRKMYSLVATNGIVVLDLNEQKQIQYLDLSSFGNRQSYMGMALWP